MQLSPLLYESFNNKKEIENTIVAYKKKPLSMYGKLKTKKKLTKK